MPRGTIVKAEHLRAGTDTIVDRYDSGSIRDHIKVVEMLPCPTDAGNIHVVQKSGKVSCYYRQADVELL